MEREKIERAHFYAAHGIKEESESRDRVEDKRARYERVPTGLRLKAGPFHLLERQSRETIRVLSSS